MFYRDIGNNRNSWSYHRIADEDGSIWKYQNFKKKREDGTQYIERMDYFLQANAITAADRKWAIFLTTIGPGAYKTLRNLITSAKIGDLSCNELFGSMQLYYSPRPSEIIQCFKFNSRFCHSGKSVSAYKAELRSLAEFWNFEGTLEVMLKDRLVCGINDEQIQRRLFSEEPLMVEKVPRNWKQLQRI